MMRDGIRLAVIGLGLIAVIGCGGSSGSPTAAGSQGAPAKTAGSGATQPPAATSAPSAAVVPSQPPGGGGGSATGVCALVTADELKGIFGVPVTTEVIAGPPDTCDIQSSDAPLAAMVLTTSGAGILFDVYASDSETKLVSGIGDKAAFLPTNQLLVVVKGDKLVSIAAFPDDKTEDERLELMKKVGVIAAGRM